jgi:hypothetical protein
VFTEEQIQTQTTVRLLGGKKAQRGLQGTSLPQTGPAGVGAAETCVLTQGGDLGHQCTAPGPLATEDPRGPCGRFGLLGQVVDTFSFLRHQQTIFQSSFFIWHSHQ